MQTVIAARPVLRTCTEVVVPLLSVPSARAALPAAAELVPLTDADLEAVADRLHDGALQALVAARYACDAVARGGDPALAREAVQQALVVLRREVWLLRPRCADGLAAALRDLAAQLEAADAPPLRPAVDADVAGRLSPAAAGTAYRLVQAVAAGTDRPLAVTLTADGPRATLALDAPVPDPAPWSLRARALGGELHVDAARTLLLLPTTEDLP